MKGKAELLEDCDPDNYQVRILEVLLDIRELLLNAEISMRCDNEQATRTRDRN